MTETEETLKRLNDLLDKNFIDPLMVKIIDND
jgi:hypothetical protein